MRAAVLLLGVLIGSPCAAKQELPKWQELFNKGEYQQALQAIHEAQMADPQNQELARLRKEVNEALFAKEFTTKQRQYRDLPQEDLERRAEMLRQVIRTTEILMLFNPYYAHTRTQLNHELQHVLSERVRVGALCRKVSDEFEKGRTEQALRDLAGLKPYKPYIREVSDQFDVALAKEWPGVEAFLDKLHAERDFVSLKQALDLVESVFPPEVSDRYRTRLARFYQDKGALFMDNRKTATALLYYTYASHFKRGSVDQPFMESLYARLRDYGEKIHVEVKGPSLTPDRIESYGYELFRSINDQCNNVFQYTRSPDDATIRMIAVLDPVDSMVEMSKPQPRYSRFISGYKKVPNEVYFRAKERVENARSQLLTVPSQPAGRPSDGGVKIEGKADWQGLLKSLDTLSSPEAFDDVPIYIDYVYSETDVRIARLAQISYRLQDAKNQAIVKEDAVQEQSESRLTILEGVHPQDANHLRNSDKFDRDSQHKDLQTFTYAVLQITAVKVSNDIVHLYEQRGKICMDLDEPAEAMDSYLMGQILKNKVPGEPGTLIIPSDLAQRIHTLTPESNLESKLAARKVLTVSAGPRPAQSTTRPEKADAAPERKKYAEIDLPKLVKDAMRKVVLIKGIPQAKVRDKKDFSLISGMNEDGALQGSGFLISSNGHVVTSHHVVKNCGAVFVKMADGNEYSAKLIETDVSADLALLKIPVKGTPFFSLGSYKKLTPGETVIAIGSPLGLEQTVSRGIISALRTGSVEKGREKLMLVQTDAQMTHGNSGGPLINLSGEAIGINTMKSPGPFGFAVSSDEIAKRLPKP